MNLEAIIALLSAKFKGVRSDGLKQLARMIALQCATEDDAKAIVDKLDEAQVKGFVKEFRADVDKEVSDGNKTFENNLKKKFDLVAKKTDPNPGGDGDDPTKGTTEAMIAAAVAKALEPITKTMTDFNAKNLKESRLQQLNEKLKDCKNAAFKERVLKDFARMSFDDDAAFADYLTDTEADVANANQNVANNGLSSQGTPMFAQKGNDGVSSAVQSYVKSMNPEGNQFAGKEL